ncbi:MAG: RidA family protein [Candidatus Dormiibacterota bacterium]|jgi:enamine deaminase RidA (YjgF/YER057c/UK114 family)|nr:RidA family protein [Candidatus Dormibacteraeota bacterium]
MTNRKLETRLAILGYPLPRDVATFGLYLPSVRVGDLVYTSGALPMKNGELVVRGHVGDDVSLEEAEEGARLCVANALAAVRAEAGYLADVVRIVKLTGYVNSAAGFTDQPAVMNAASQFLIDVFEDAGRCARSAVGVAELPLGAAVEVELVAQLRS